MLLSSTGLATTTLHVVVALLRRLRLLVWLRRLLLLTKAVLQVLLLPLLQMLRMLRLLTLHLHLVTVPPLRHLLLALSRLPVLLFPTVLLLLSKQSKMQLLCTPPSLC